MVGDKSPYSQPRNRLVTAARRPTGNWTRPITSGLPVTRAQSPEDRQTIRHGRRARPFTETEPVVKGHWRYTLKDVSDQLFAVDIRLDSTPRWLEASCVSKCLCRRQRGSLCDRSILGALVRSGSFDRYLIGRGQSACANSAIARDTPEVYGRVSSPGSPSFGAPLELTRTP